MIAIHRAVAVLVCTSLCLLTACGSLVPGASKQAKQLTILQSAEPKTLDPTVSALSHEGNVISQVLDNMVWTTEDMKADPKLALSWQNIDPLTWEVKLRTGVKFTNGEPFNAESVVESFKYMTRPDAVGKAQLAAWTSIERVDDATVRVRTAQPDPRFVSTLLQLYILPAGVLKSNPGSLGDNPIGTGPYKFVEWVKGERIVLEANPDYWRGRPKIDRLIFKSVPEASARVAALQAGQADLIVNVPPESADLLDKGANSKVMAVPGLRNITIIFDNRSKPFDDVRVRQAMNYAIDKESIIKNILGGRGEIQTSPSHSKTENHNADLKPYPYDPEKAKQLLAQAGYPNGFEIEFHHPTGRWIKDVEVSQAIAGMLEKVGVKTKLMTGEYGAFFTAWSKGEFSGMTMIGTLNLFDSDQVVQLFLYSKGQWAAYSKDAKLDTLYEAEANQLDPAKRAPTLKEMEAHIYEQAPWLFLYFQADLWGANKKLKWNPPLNERVVFTSADLE